MGNLLPWRDDEFRLVFGRSQIEYDSEKETINRAKHGYSLESAAHLLSRLLLPAVQPPFIIADAGTPDERRHLLMTIDDGKVVFIVVTMRPDESIRIISFRRASPDERADFAAHTGFRERGAPSASC